MILLLNVRVGIGTLLLNLELVRPSGIKVFDLLQKSIEMVSLASGEVNEVCL